ncbi:hypothetical protein [Shewanella waksmanii]|uniref:hypothetical protein n=1 Tax=Shewanella waksmanii TaxID=213783 RepID=UPI0037359ACB
MDVFTAGHKRVRTYPAGGAVFRLIISMIMASPPLEATPFPAPISKMTTTFPAAGDTPRRKRYSSPRDNSPSED